MFYILNSTIFILRVYIYWVNAYVTFHLRIANHVVTDSRCRAFAFFCQKGKRKRERKRRLPRAHQTRSKERERETQRESSFVNKSTHEREDVVVSFFFFTTRILSSLLGERYFYRRQSATTTGDYMRPDVRVWSKLKVCAHRSDRSGRGDSVFGWNHGCRVDRAEFDERESGNH